jgi:hypothetical protein
MGLRWGAAAALLHCHTSEKPMKINVMVRGANHLADSTMNCSKAFPCQTSENHCHGERSRTISPNLHCSTRPFSAIPPGACPELRRRGQDDMDLRWGSALIMQHCKTIVTHNDIHNKNHCTHQKSTVMVSVVEPSHGYCSEMQQGISLPNQ